MRRLFLVLCVMLSAGFMLSACLGSNSSETTVYDDTALTGLTLGTLNRYLHTTAHDGSDSVYKQTVNASKVVMSIDHLNGRVYNLDSLPLGCDLKHVTCTLTTHRNGLALIKSITSDSLFYHSQTDSVDFSVPRTVRVYSSDGAHYRDYTITLNVKQSTMTGISWQEVSVAEYDSRDTRPAQESISEAAGMTLAGVSTREMFALTTDGQLMTTSNGGKTWQPETLDGEEELLPRQRLAWVSWPYAKAGNADYTLLVGVCPGATDRMYVWRKIATYNNKSTDIGGLWTCMTTGAKDSRYYLPSNISVSLAYCGYSAGVLAFGSDGNVYRSMDQGITWKKDTSYTLPSGASGMLSAVTSEDYATVWLKSPQQGRAWKGTVLK